MQALQIKLLGRFETLSGEGEPISLPMRKAEVLLAFLALAPGLRHPRERLINLLWSDRGEEQARNSLRQCLSAIRKSLGDAAELALQVDRTTISLNAELIEVDVLEFERLASDADYESLVTAADLYQGEFLEGISIRDAACQEWLDSERTRFRRQFVEILYNLAETQLVSHDYRNAIRSAERLVEQDPLVEAGWRLLMQSYAGDGDRGHALQAFKRCRQVLRDELEVEPEAATFELRNRIAGGSAMPQGDPEIRPPAPAYGNTGIVVLPFDNLSGDPEQEYFSDGITDSVIMNLALFPGLAVKSRNSSFAFKKQIKSLGEISRELDVDYLVEGSVRRSAGRIRINVQLIEAASGNQVWGKRYDSDLDDLFDLEEDLCRSIAATVTGKIESELQRIALNKGASDQQAYDLLLAGIYHGQRANRKDNAIAIEKLNACLERDPNNARAHAWLYDCHHFSIMDRWSDNIDRSRQLAIKHIQRAVELEPEQKSVLLSYIDYLTFQHRYDEAEAQVQRALAKNPNEAGAYAARAVNLSSMGQWPEAVEAAEIALRLDPYNYWGRWILAESLFFCDRYEECLDTIAETGNAPGFILVYNIAANIELGRRDAALKSLDRFIQFCAENMHTPPASIDEWRQYFLDNAPFADSSANERILKLLLEAGLGEENPVSENAIPSIAVLPFENLSDDAEQEHFADGITADLVDTLSRFKHLRTVSRFSTLQYKSDRPPIAEIAQQQQVRYILEGSVRRSGNRIRVNAELIDSDGDKILWSDRYDRDLDDLFAVQDELTQNIALALKVQLDDGEMARIRSRGATSIKAWELTMAAVDLQDTYIRQNLLEARKLASEATRVDPDYAYAWISLGWTHWQEVYSGWEVSVEGSIAEAEKALARAREIEPEYSEVYGLSGMIRLMKHDTEAAIRDCLRAVELEPGNAEIQALAAFTHVFAGEYQKGRSYERQVRRLCPVRANWYFLIDAQIEVAGGNFERAAELYHAGLAVEPESPLCRFFLVDLMLRSGDEKAARGYADEIRALDAKVSGRGIALTYSADPELRRAFHDRLARFDLV